MSVGVTAHGYKRSKERVKIKGKRVERYAQLAFERGVHSYNSNDLDLSRGIFEHSSSNGLTDVVIYDCYYWIFDLNGNLITTLDVEKNIRKAYENYNHKLNTLIV